MRTLEKELCYTAEHSYGYQWGLGSLPSQVFTVVNQSWRDQSHFRCLLQCSCSHLRAIDRVPQQRWVGRLCSHKPQCCVGQHAPMLLCGVRAAGINCETATIKCVSVQLLWHWSLILWSYRLPQTHSTWAWMKPHHMYTDAPQVTSIIGLWNLWHLVSCTQTTPTWFLKQPKAILMCLRCQLTSAMWLVRVCRHA